MGDTRYGFCRSVALYHRRPDRVVSLRFCTSACSNNKFLILYKAYYHASGKFYISYTLRLYLPSIMREMQFPNRLHYATQTEWNLYSIALKVSYKLMASTRTAKDNLSKHPE